MPVGSPITLVGRATDLAFTEYESGATLSSFTLTCRSVGDRPALTIRCEGYGKTIAETFERMAEGCLVGVIGKLRKTRGEFQGSVIIDRLEYLGAPLKVAS